LHLSLKVLRTVAGIGADHASHLERWLSVTGGLAGLAGVMLISQAQLGPQGSVGLVASMGASAVLLFAVPHGPLSQPWPVLGGHLVSALVGVACTKVIAQPMLAAPVAVGLAIGSMHYLRCIHPPGGATALSAVVGGEPVQHLGFQFVLTPVLWNAVVILAIALLFNYPFTWRRYPLALARRGATDGPPPAGDSAQPESRDAR
jgi:CBS-domain-containing membrane protein